MATYLYTRVSTNKQETARQINEVEKQYKFDKIFEDKRTGKNTDRPALRELKEIVKEGDAIICLSLDRLSRSTIDSHELFDFFISRGIRIICLKEGIDTAGSYSKFFMTIISALAEVERENIVERIQQSAEYYKENGVTPKGKTNWGRARKTVDELPKNFKKYYEQLQANEINKSEMARLLGISRQGLYKWLKLYERER